MVYLDAPLPTDSNFGKYLHMWADSDRELHQFAETLGVSQSRFRPVKDFHHYELAYSKFYKALELGAKQMIYSGSRAILV